MKHLLIIFMVLASVSRCFGYSFLELPDSDTNDFIALIELGIFLLVFSPVGWCLAAVLVFAIIKGIVVGIKKATTTDWEKVQDKHGQLLTECAKAESEPEELDDDAKRAKLLNDLFKEDDDET